MGQFTDGSDGSWVTWVMVQFTDGSDGFWVTWVMVSSLMGQMGQMGHGTRGSWVSSLMGQMGHGSYDVTRCQICRQKTSMVALLTTRNPKPMDAQCMGKGVHLRPGGICPPPWIEHLLPLGRLEN